MRLLECPDDVLGAIVERLQQKDRLRLEGSCKRLQEVSRGAAWAGGEASLTALRGRSIFSFLAWAAKRPAVTAISVDADLHYLLHRGGRLLPAYCHALAPLAHVTRMHLTVGPRDQFATVACCSGVTRLSLRMISPPDDAWEHLAFVGRLPRLAALSLAPAEYFEYGAAEPWLTLLSHITELDLPAAPEHFGEVLGFSCLQTLALNGTCEPWLDCRHEPLTGVPGNRQLLASHTRLTSLLLTACHVHFKAFASLPSLRELRLQECTVCGGEARDCAGMVRGLTLLEVCASRNWPLIKQSLDLKRTASDVPQHEGAGLGKARDWKLIECIPKRGQLRGRAALDSVYLLSVPAMLAPTALDNLVEVGVDEYGLQRLKLAITLALKCCSQLQCLCLGLGRCLDQHQGAAVVGVLEIVRKGLKQARWLRRVRLSAACGPPRSLFTKSKSAETLLWDSFELLLDAGVSVCVAPCEVLSEVGEVWRRVVEARHRTEELVIAIMGMKAS